MYSKYLSYFIIIWCINLYVGKAKVKKNKNDIDNTEYNINLENIDITAGEDEIDYKNFLKTCDKFENDKIYRRDLIECFFSYFINTRHYDSFKQRQYYNNWKYENLKIKTDTIRDYLKNKILIDFFKKIKNLYLTKNEVEKIIKKSLFIKYFKHRFKHQLFYIKKLKHDKENAHLYKDPKPFSIEL